MELNKIEALVKEAFEPDHIQVSGDGYHHEISLVSDKFEGKSQVQRQQMVYSVLMEHIQSGELHALSIKAATPQEHQDK